MKDVPRCFLKKAASCFLRAVCLLIPCSKSLQGALVKPRLLERAVLDIKVCCRRQRRLVIGNGPDSGIISPKAQALGMSPLVEKRLGCCPKRACLEFAENFEGAPPKSVVV